MMPTDVPDTLNTLGRSEDTSSSAAAASHSQPLDLDLEENILDDIELEEAQHAKKGRRKRRSTTADEAEDDWTVELRQTMKTNQALLERLLVDRPQPQTRREAFIRYVSDVLRTAPEDDYQVMQDKIAATIMEPQMGPSTSGAGAAVASQPTTTIQQPSFLTQPSFSRLAVFPSPSPTSWPQYGVVVEQPPPPSQSQSQSQSQSLMTPDPAPVKRSSAESIGKALSSQIVDDWNL